MARRALSASRRKRVLARVRRGAQEPLARPVARLVLGMDGHPLAPGPQHPAHRLVVAHEERPGRAAHEELDAGHAGEPLEFGQTVHVLRRRAHEEAVVDPGAARRPRELVAQRRLVGRRGVGVRHLQEGGDAPEQGGAAPALQILLVGEARLAEVDLGVNRPGQDREPARLHRPRGLALHDPDRGDPAVPHREVALERPLAGREAGVAEEEVVAHGGLWLPSERRHGKGLIAG